MPFFVMSTIIGLVQAKFFKSHIRDMATPVYYYKKKNLLAMKIKLERRFYRNPSQISFFNVKSNNSFSNTG